MSSERYLMKKSNPQKPGSPSPSNFSSQQNSIRLREPIIDQPRPTEEIAVFGPRSKKLSNDGQMHIQP